MKSKKIQSILEFAENTSFNGDSKKSKRIGFSWQYL